MSKTSLRKSSCPNSITNLIQSSHQDCDWYEAPQGITGKGKQGEVFQVCCRTNNNCQFVVKRQLGVSMERAEREVTLQTKFWMLGLAPEVVDAWWCEHEFLMVMPKLQYTLKQFIQEVYELNNKELANKVAEALKAKIHPMLRLAHSNKLVHNDLKLDNMMLNGDVDTGKIHEVFFIDFGKSKVVSSEAVAEHEEPFSDLELSFNSLLNNISDYVKSAFKPPSINRKRETKFKRLISTPETPMKASIVSSPRSSSSGIKRALFGAEDEPEVERQLTSVKRSLMFD